jgi:hypothetical protein
MTILSLRGGAGRVFAETKVTKQSPVEDDEIASGAFGEAPPLATT